MINWGSCQEDSHKDNDCGSRNIPRRAKRAPSSPTSGLQPAVVGSGVARGLAQSSPYLFQHVDTEDIQPFALVPFFHAGNFGEGTFISSVRASKASPALAKMSAIDGRDVAMYVDYWKNIGFLHV